jgi:hypothetical protein
VLKSSTFLAFFLSNLIYFPDTTFVQRFDPFVAIRSKTYKYFEALSNSNLIKYLAMKYLQFLLFVLISSSCSAVLYSPTTQNVPLFKEKGEVNIGAGIIGTPDENGFDIKTAVAVDSSLAVAFSYNSFKGGSKSSTDRWDSRAKYLEAAIGKFGSAKQGPWVYEAFLGLGYASIKHEKSSQSLRGPKDEIRTKFIKPYIQPSFGIRSKFIDFAVTPRIAMVSYLSDRVNIADKEQAASANEFFDNKKTSIVFEPGATLRLGVRNFKLQFQYVYTSFSYNSSSSLTYYDHIVSVGINFYPK